MIEIDRFLVEAAADTVEPPEVNVYPFAGEVQDAHDAKRQRLFAQKNQKVMSHLIADDSGRQWRVTRIDFQEQERA